ncbi:hypothetical protein PF005_g21789 [Phytophthora fragariae]|uniref:Kazal-like domain-containing protein n=1 Tax=Phytophthora fragariae TaxID=53985 RepID=A0A6A3IWB6_9STRA|nr:hypothetical protein PF003_g24272 [Phytophthora fragariae]KAE8891516.1 hypothetical protein PF003_g24273 [Phytophthora fragariae]KAE8891517.1 hypothetical protein PF003_g24270 [Phytophthora fragariae]KAE8891518.1 hypothetical protein PF003_g24271 [Phytophthora fragariae]KAE8891519.1 hypothetical protein PF003_g24276 [Phytophthora fragariae]
MKFSAVAVLASLVMVGISAQQSSLRKLGASCTTVKCSSKRNAVCGSNGVTYRNKCEFGNDNCLNGRKWYVASNGDCPNVDTYALDQHPRV